MAETLTYPTESAMNEKVVYLHVACMPVLYIHERMSLYTKIASAWNTEFVIGMTPLLGAGLNYVLLYTYLYICTSQIECNFVFT